MAAGLGIGDWWTLLFARGAAGWPDHRPFGELEIGDEDFHFLESHWNKMFTFANPLILRAFLGAHSAITGQ